MHFLSRPSLRVRRSRSALSACLLASTIVVLAGSCRTATAPPVSSNRSDASVDTGGGGRIDAPGERPSETRPVVGACVDRPAVGKAGGQKCGCHDECASGACVDGVCCNSPCTGTCQACNVPGSVGVCSPIPDGAFPVVAGQCTPEPASTCGMDGRCDGHGTCRRHVDGTVCGPGTCADSTVVGMKVCAQGICKEGGQVSCAPYACDPATNACFPRCTTDEQCAGAKCVAGSCGKKPLGAVCTDAVDCESGACVDGVCCNTQCTGPCMNCKEPGKLGRCSPAAAGRPDPHGICPTEGPETCGTTGLCNGQGGCAQHPVGSICRAASCDGATLIPASVCDESHTCISGTPLSCAPFLCAEGICRGNCQTDDQCLVPATCVGGTCGPKGLGQPCGAGTECASGFCTDGVCCDSGCEGLCHSCALPNAPGRCTPVPAGVLDPRGASGVTDPARACVDQGEDKCGTNGRCDGQGTCQRYDDGTICEDPSCDPVSNRSSIGTCNDGTCQVTTRGCAPHLCNGDSCGIRCDNNTQCIPTNVCQDGSCGKRPDGEPCSENKPEECASGICAQGVCCHTACKGTCLSCALPGAAGVCTAVPSGGVDPSKTCVDQKPVSCGTDGKCDGQGGCRKYAVGAVCLQPTCKAGMATRASFCDATGACPAPATETCTPIIVCNAAGTACEKTCTKDNQCLAGTKCFGGKCGLLDDGQACDENSDCKSKSCTDGVCCNTACGGNNKNDCEACSVKEGASKDGVCTPRTGRTCNDGNACTKTDVCVASPAAPGAVCTGTMPVVCKASDQCHAVGVCDPAKGTCSNPALPDTTPCNDGNMCTTDDKCTAGKCVPGAPKACPAPNQCQNVCDAATGMCNPPKADNTKCNDGNACTTGQDVCKAGVCTGKAKTCPAIDTCHTAGTCNPADGVCSTPEKMPGTPCEAGNLCLTGDTCQAGGKCVEGTAMVACGTATCKLCNPSTGKCDGKNKPDSTPCDDGNKCTTVDRCEDGKCDGSQPVTCPARDKDCQKCDPGTGTCVADATKVGLKCGDGLSCTGMEKCTAAGVCIGVSSCPLACQACLPGGCMPATCPAPGPVPP